MYGNTSGPVHHELEAFHSVGVCAGAARRVNININENQIQQQFAEQVLQQKEEKNKQKKGSFNN